MCYAFHIYISKQLYSCTAYLNKTFKQCFYHKSHKPGIKCEVIYGDDTGTAVNTLQYVYHTPRSLSAEITPLLAKQKVTHSSQVWRFPCQSFRGKCERTLEPPLKIVTKDQAMKAICNFFPKKRKDKESIDQPQKL